MKRLQVWFPYCFNCMIVGMVIGFRLRENTTTNSFFKLQKNSIAGSIGPHKIEIC